MASLFGTTAFTNTTTLPAKVVDTNTNTLTATAQDRIIFENLTLNGVLNNKRISFSDSFKATTLLFLAEHNLSGHAPHRPAAAQLVDLGDRVRVPKEYGPAVYKTIMKKVIDWVLRHAVASEWGPLIQPGGWAATTEDWSVGDLEFQEIADGRDALMKVGEHDARRKMRVEHKIPGTKAGATKLLAEVADLQCQQWDSRDLEPMRTYALTPSKTSTGALAKTVTTIKREDTDQAAALQVQLSQALVLIHHLVRQVQELEARQACGAS